MISVARPPFLHQEVGRMANILEELWRGNVVPYGSVRHTPEMTQLMGYIARHHEKLTSNLTGELKETFEKLDDCWNEYAELCDKEVFIHAFRLGMQIAIAAMTERDE
jgi:hypothetical protein